MVLKNTAIIGILAIILASFACAFGVSSPYSKGDVLEMAPGETTTVNLNLQNMVGDSDVVFEAGVITGREIAEFNKKNYLVKIGTFNTLAPLEISLPRNASGSYPIELEFKTVPGGAGGGIGMAVSFPVSFKVKATGEPVEKKIPVLEISLLVAGIIVLIIIIVFIIRRRKKLKSIKNKRLKQQDKKV